MADTCHALNASSNQNDTKVQMILITHVQQHNNKCARHIGPQHDHKGIQIWFPHMFTMPNRSGVQV